MIAKDSLLPHSKQMIRDIKDINTMVIVATAREMQDADFHYISENLGTPNYMVYRKPDDNRKGVELKNTGITKHVGELLEHFENITIYEDNIEYLQGMTEYLEKFNNSVYPIHVPSNQGH